MAKYIVSEAPRLWGLSWNSIWFPYLHFWWNAAKIKFLDYRGRMENKANWNVVAELFMQFYCLCNIFFPFNILDMLVDLWTCIWNSDYLSGYLKDIDYWKVLFQIKRNKFQYLFNIIGMHFIFQILKQLLFLVCPMLLLII